VHILGRWLLCGDSTRPKSMFFSGFEGSSTFPEANLRSYFARGLALGGASHESGIPPCHHPAHRQSRIAVVASLIYVGSNRQGDRFTDYLSPITFALIALILRLCFEPFLR
jgi:hypothetical protein